ncbi:CPBP family intramembrane glutamic endopeptidase [Paenibacillus sp. MBLB4367]|uniref:CPBP family intramembrane glutamic endopeptidase n=1 Tax=Paenibacillus sp. MBLB4367 TaxID=3384767 RepID=UPI0039082DB0
MAKYIFVRKPKIINYLFKIVLFILLETSMIFVLLSVNVAFNLKLDVDNIFSLDIQPFLLTIYFLLLFPDIRKHFFDQFLKNSHKYKVIIFSIIIGVTENLLIDLSRFIPLMFGNEMIGVGKHQYTSDLNYFPESLDFLFLGLFPGFTEEFIFRFLPYTLLFIFLSNLRLNKKIDVQEFKTNKDSKIQIQLRRIIDNIYMGFYIEKKFSYLLVWIILVSIMFSLAHGPDYKTFYLYFVGGVINSVLFLRWGFLAAMLSHAAFNTFSRSNHILIEQLFSLY